MNYDNPCPHCVWLFDDRRYGPVWYCRRAVYHDGNYYRNGCQDRKDDAIHIGHPPGYNGMATLGVLFSNVAQRGATSLEYSNSAAYLNGLTEASGRGLVCKREADRVTDQMRQNWGLK
jgi:hypothetical protein